MTVNPSLAAEFEATREEKLRPNRCVIETRRAEGTTNFADAISQIAYRARPGAFFSNAAEANAAIDRSVDCQMWFARKGHTQLDHSASD